jgi:hypothetical protein
MCEFCKLEDPICMFCPESLDEVGGVIAANGPVCSYCVELADGEVAEDERRSA